jgi:cytochrome c5
MSLIHRLYVIFLGIFVLYIPLDCAAMTGKEIYERHCFVCHASGLAGAPKFQVEADWTKRCEQKHLSGLVKSAMKGLNAMPAKGTCDTCEAIDIRHAIEYMVNKNEKKCQ